MVHKGRKVYLKKQAQNETENYTKVSKKAKIIVRNLPFKNLSEESVENLFREFGDIEEVKLLKKEDGKFVGCGFVQFKKVSSAAKAIRYGNEKEVYGRKIVVDWALPKNTFLEKAQKLEKEFDLSNIKTEVTSDDEDSERKFKKGANVDTWSSEDENSYDTENENGDEDDDDDDDSDNDDTDNKEKLKRNFEQKIKKQITKQEQSPHGRSDDVDEGKTVFIRNIPFSTTNDELKERMEQYGPIEYALICVDKLTEHSKGTAFVKFKERESALRCIKDSEKIYLEDNALLVTIAVSKENLQDKTKAKKTVKDSRNLYLVREGVVIAGSTAATGVSAADMAKRLQLEQWKTQILKNLNMFVSKTRLVVHNLPPAYDDDRLKQLFLKHSNPKAIVKEAKVMRDKKQFDAQGNGVSKEVGFVSFTNHEDALTALRNINNNPKIFTPKRRPIVAFSIENKAVINAKERRIQKSRAKLGIIVDSKMSKFNSKQRRFLRRRQKLIEKRRETKKRNPSSSEPVKVDSKKVSSENKRKHVEEKEEEENVRRKKTKIDHSSDEHHRKGERSEFAGVTSDPGKKVKLRSKFRLKTQANIHSETLKKERRKRRERKRRKMEPTKQPKQKKGKSNLYDDSRLSKLISKHRESVQSSSVLKKWYDK